jgi:internalin A
VLSVRQSELSRALIARADYERGSSNKSLVATKTPEVGMGFWKCFSTQDRFAALCRTGRRPLGIFTHPGSAGCDFQPATTLGLKLFVAALLCRLCALLWQRRRSARLLLATLFFLSFEASAQVVTIPDPGLLTAIRGQLKKPTGDITVADMASLKLLCANGLQIVSLEGLQTATNLTELLLTANRPADLTPLASLTSLTNLILFANRLTNFFLPTLTNLIALDLSYNYLTNPATPAGLNRMTSLSALNLSHNQLTSLEMPHGLGKLALLDLSFNQLTRFSLPPGATNLAGVVLLGNQLTNLTAPPGLCQLSDLDLNYNHLYDFSPLASLTNLTSLSLQHNGLTNLTLPPELYSLTYLLLTDNYLSDCSFLRGLTNLTSLYLALNALTNSPPLGTLTHLVDLSLDYNYLTSLTLPETLTHLAGLGLSHNLLTNLVVPLALDDLANLSVDWNPLISLALPARNPSFQLFAPSSATVTFFPIMKSPRMWETNFIFDVFAIPGNVAVLRSTDLTNWTTIGSVTIFTPTYTGISFIDLNSPPAGAFYRLVQ